jgi:hypothetical protein
VVVDYAEIQAGGLGIGRGGMVCGGLLTRVETGCCVLVMSMIVGCGVKGIADALTL